MHNQSPITTAKHPTTRIVLLAMLPGVFAMLMVFGFGFLTNIFLSVLFAAISETFALRLRAQAIAAHLRDERTWVTPLLIALALPPFASWWLLLLANAFAILLVKHAYGANGQHSFNPALAGIALLLVLFPAHFAAWPAPAGLDGYTMATALDIFKQNRADTVADWWAQHRQLGRWGGYGWEWINFAFLAGGLYLAQQKIIPWLIPLGVLAALGLFALFFYDNGSSASAGSPLFHWLSGATMLGAFFIATEPATSPRTNRGRIIFGALIGTLIFAIRHWGNYPDGVAFAVLLANVCVPLLAMVAHEYEWKAERDRE